jgi:hypothetical protein
MNTASNTCLRLTTQVGQAHVATRVLLDLGTNSQPHRPKNAAEHKTQASLTYTGQAGEQHRSDQYLLVKPGEFHRIALHRPGRCNTPVRRSQPESPKTPNRPTELQTDPNSKQQQHEATENLPKCSPEQNPTGVGTGQTGVAWASRDEHHPWVNTPKSKLRSPESLHGLEQDFGDSRNTSWGVHSQDYVHQNLPNQEESKKSRQELL